MKNVCELCQLYSPSGCAKLSNEPCLKEAVQLLKDSVTNGDMIKAMVPNLQVVDVGIHRLIVTFWDYHNIMYRNSFDVNWWNAPFKIRR